MIVNKLFEDLVAEQCELRERLEVLIEERSRWYYRGAAAMWRARVRWVIGELRTLDREIERVHTCWFWSRFIGGAL